MQSTMEEMRSDAKEDRDLKHAEALKTLLKPSAAPQDRIDEIKREQVPGMSTFLLTYLASVDASLAIRFMSSTNVHASGSGDWIRAEETLQSWIDPNQQPLLWVSGNPGSGKSFLTYNIITYIHDLALDGLSAVPEDACAAYFFFRDNNVSTQSVQQALRDMSYQLTQTSPAYEKHLARASHSPGEIASVRTAWSTLFKDYWLDDEAAGTAYLFLDGLDESLKEERDTLFELLKDVQDAESASHLRIVMLGRPQITDELAYALDGEPPTIHIEPSKNGADIAHYVEASITKSRALNKASKKLKATIIETLTQKAGGMFMWVKLMIADLNRKAQRLRESDVEKALHQAPKGLTEMLKHVLEGYSASMSEAEASDLNDMLMWVCLAKRPLYLGELDAALRLKSEEGEGLLDLEGNLRKAYASLFTLSRDDGLTTAELLSPKRSYDDEDEDAVAGADEGDGEDDLDFPSQFDSNPKTTTISFSHASISDFFRDPKQGKVKAAGEDCPEIGVNLEEAQISIVRICTDIIVDDTLRDRMKDAVSLAGYAGSNWAEHLQQASYKAASTEDKLHIGVNVARMMHDNDIYPSWAGFRNYLYFAEGFAKPMLPWIKSQELAAALAPETAAWLDNIDKANILDIFEPVLKFCAQRWLLPKIGAEYRVEVVPRLIYAWQARKRGEVVQEIPELNAERILSGAEWAGLEQTAEWHRRLAMTYRDVECWDDAKRHFEKALELDSGLWMALAGIAMLHYRREEYEEAIKCREAILTAVEADTTHDESFKTISGRWASYSNLGEIYSSMSGKIDSEFTKATFALDTKSFVCFRQAVKYKPADYDALARCIYYYHNVLQLSELDEDQDHDQEGTSEKHTDTPDIPTAAECHERIMELVHEVDGTLRDDKHTNFVHSLMENKYDSGDYFQILSNAARETGQLEWLQDRYRAAISAARTDLQPVTAACLSLCLAELHYKYGDQDKAMRIWEGVGLQSAQTTKVESEITYARWQALNKLGMHCITRAFEDETQADKWIGKMERIIAKQHGRRGAAAAAQSSIPPNEIALYVAAWYCKQGRNEEARELVKPHVKEALVILSDDDPSNDSEGYMNMTNAFTAVRDDVNAIAVLQAIRPMKKGVAVLASDSKTAIRDGDTTDLGNEEADTPTKTNDKVDDAPAEDAAATGAEKDGDEQEEDDEDEEAEPIWSCDGPCVRSFLDFDDAICCRMGCAMFCRKCYTLFLEDRVPFRVCSRAHEHITIPPLEKSFKEGELVVDGRVMTLDEWKKGIKKSWGL